MGQKTNPILFRITSGNSAFSWTSDWYHEKKAAYANAVVEDLKILSYFKNIGASTCIGEVKIERKSDQPHIFIRTSKSSLIIGKNGKGIDGIVKDLFKILKKEVILSIIDIKRPEIEANLVAKTMAEQIVKRMPFKKVAKTTLESVMRAGAIGVKIIFSGRLNGAEIARSESFKNGPMPLHSMRANINYALSEAKTTYGIIGIKIWIYTQERGKK